MKTIYFLAKVKDYEDLEIILKKKEYSKYSLHDGKEIITGTNCIEVCFDLKEFLYFYPLNKNTLIINYALIISEEEVLEKLESLTREDIIEYKRKIKEAKRMQQSIHADIRTEQKTRLKNEKQKKYKLRSLIRKSRYM